MDSDLGSKTPLQLMSLKESIEKEIKEYNGVLESQEGVGMDGPLLDQEGYPRSDIDLYAVRIARNKIICLRNDYKAVMSKIESKLYQIHAEARQGGGATPTSEGGSPAILPNEKENGFARVNSVAEGSPSAIAGLKVNDVLVEFGSVNHSTFKDIHDVGTVVQHSIGRPVRVVIDRKGSMMVLSLTPRAWSGRGLLGCNVVPLLA